MKRAIAALAAAILSGGLAAANGGLALPPAPARVWPAGCAVAPASWPGDLPRAGLVVENRRDERLHLRLEDRSRSGRTPVDLGIVGRGERMTVPYALPAGRNVLAARSESGGVVRMIFHVPNRGPDTCTRRYFWPIM
jgi:hypothetical protein